MGEDKHYWYSTEAIEYTVIHNETLCRLPSQPYERPCPFMAVSFANRQDYILFPCSSCSGGDDYYPSCQQKFRDELQSHYPYISRDCADKVVNTFTGLLDRAHAAYRCPFNLPRLDEVALHSLEFELRRLLTQELLDMVAAPLSRTRTSTRIEEEEEEDCECVICMEAMDKKPRSSSTLTMPCSHTFHGLCLVQWLNNSSSCPICRYHLPTDEDQDLPTDEES